MTGFELSAAAAGTKVVSARAVILIHNEEPTELRGGHPAFQGLDHGLKMRRCMLIHLKVTLTEPIQLSTGNIEDPVFGTGAPTEPQMGTGAALIRQGIPFVQTELQLFGFGDNLNQLFFHYIPDTILR